MTHLDTKAKTSVRIAYIRQLERELQAIKYQMIAELLEQITPEQREMFGKLYKNCHPTPTQVEWAIRQLENTIEGNLKRDSQIKL